VSDAAKKLNKVRTLRWPLDMAVGEDWQPCQEWFQYSGGVKTDWI